MRKSSFYYHEGRGVVYRRLGFLGFPNYRVGTDGSLWSMYTIRGKGRIGKWRRCNPHKDELGYRHITLCQHGQRKVYKMHALVLLAFVGPCPQGMECRHFPDTTPWNNDLSNIRWDTHARNQADQKGIPKPTAGARGQEHPAARFTDEMALWMRMEAKKDTKRGRYARIARKLRKVFDTEWDTEFCNLQTRVRRVVEGINWRHM